MIIKQVLKLNLTDLLRDRDTTLSVNNPEPNVDGNTLASIDTAFRNVGYRINHAYYVTTQTGEQFEPAE